MTGAPSPIFMAPGPWFTVVMMNAVSWGSATLHVPAPCAPYALWRAKGGGFGHPWDAVAIFQGRLDNLWGDEVVLPTLPYATRERARA